MKKKPIIAAIAVLAIVLIAGSSIAYFNSKDTADNVFTVGNVKIELTEDPWDPDEEHIISAKASFEKEPIVKNTGSNDAYVRLRVNVTDYDLISEACGGIDLKSLFDGWDPDGNWEVVSEEPQADGSKDYVFRYKNILHVGEETEPLFNAVKFPNEVDMEKIMELPETFDISIKAEAIQAQGFEDAEKAFEAFDEQQ